MMAEVNKLLVIEHSVLAAMAGNPDFLREFPFLSMVNNPISRKSGCNACSRASAGRVVALNNVKSALLAMGVEKKQRLKKMLNAEKIRMRIATSGRVTEHTF